MVLLYLIIEVFLQWSFVSDQKQVKRVTVTHFGDENFTNMVTICRESLAEVFQVIKRL